MALNKSVTANGFELSKSNGHKTSNGNGFVATVGTPKRDADRSAAAKCMIYLLLTLALFGWLLFDTWIQKHSVARLLRYDLGQLNTAGFRLVAFSMIAGGIGGAIDGIRSILNYCESFNRKHTWKYISVPWMGCTLGLFVYALLHSSISMLGGNGAAGGTGQAQVLANFAVGALAGFGSKDVFIWLDDKVHRIFQITETVPNVKGKPQRVATSRLEAANLEVGEVAEVQANGKSAGTVLDQSPPPGASIDRGKSVDIAVAANGKTH